MGIRNVLVTILCLAINAITTAAAFGEDERLSGMTSLLATTRTIRVVIPDDVSDGCFTNKDAVQTAIELALRKNGIEVLGLEDKGFADTFIFSAMGYRSHSQTGNDLGCYVAIEAGLVLTRLVLVPYLDGRTTFTGVTYYVTENLLSGPDKLDSRIKSAAVDATEKLINEMLKARQSFFADHPEIKSKFESSN
jgi:hypothetical protein